MWETPQDGTIAYLFYFTVLSLKNKGKYFSHTQKYHPNVYIYHQSKETKKSPNRVKSFVYPSQVHLLLALS